MNVKVRDFLQKYSCFFVFGWIIGTYELSIFNILLLNLLFCVCICIIELQNENRSKYVNLILDNLYILYISIVFGILDTSLLKFAIIATITIILVNLRVNNILNIKA